MQQRCGWTYVWLQLLCSSWNHSAASSSVLARSTYSCWSACTYLSISMIQRCKEHMMSTEVAKCSGCIVPDALHGIWACP